MTVGLTPLRNTDVPVSPNDHVGNRSDSNLSLSDGLFLAVYRHVRHDSIPFLVFALTMADVIEVIVRAQPTRPIPLLSRPQRPIEILRSLSLRRWPNLGFTNSIRRRLARIPQPSVGKVHRRTNRPEWDSTTTWREARGVEHETHETPPAQKNLIGGCMEDTIPAVWIMAERRTCATDRVLLLPI